jgi:hypothetical protein
MSAFELADSDSALREGNLYVCVSLGGTPFVLLAITVLCIAISCVLWKTHSLIYLNFCCLISFAFSSDSDIRMVLSSWLVKYLAGFGKFSSNCASGKMLAFGSLSSLSDIDATCNVILLR